MYQSIARETAETHEPRLLHASTATVYLTGPMTATRGPNFLLLAELVRAAESLRARGLAVLTPHEKDSDLDAVDLRSAMEWDVEALVESDAVVVMPGWEDSPACVVEVDLAVALGKQVVPFEEAIGTVAA